jgi:diguanylate cyclase (GGDEF)-like protein
MKSKDPVDYLSDLKIKVYRRSLLIAVLVITIVWVMYYMHDPDDLLMGFVLPFFISFCIISLLLFYKYETRFLQLFEYTGFGFIFLYFLSQFIVEITDSLTKPGLDFQKFLLWIAILYTFSFLVFTVRRALQWSLFYILCMLIVGIGYSFARRGQAGLEEDIHLLVQTIGSGLIYISLLYAIAKLKEKYSEAEIKSELMSSLANLDSLTGAFSRIKIEELLNYYITNINVHAQPLSVMMLDMDKLKLTNDTFGHEAGDHVLRRTVELCRLNLRKDDALGRIGGDEFLLVCPNTSPEQAELLATRLEANVAAAEFGNYGRRTISVGIATWQPSDTSQTLIKRADDAMYAKKKEKLSMNNNYL